MSFLEDYLDSFKRRRKKLKFTYNELNDFEIWELTVGKNDLSQKPKFYYEYKFLRDKFEKIADSIVLKRRAEGKSSIRVTSFEKKIIGTFLNTLTKEEKEIYERSPLAFGHVFDLALKAAAPYGISAMSLSEDPNSPLYYFFNVLRAKIMHAAERKASREPRKRIKQRKVPRSRGSID